MKLKTKLTLGIGLLFLLLIVLSAVGVRYSYELKSDTDNILVDNYTTIRYMKESLYLLENPNESSLKKFNDVLTNQEKNITEDGEQEATQKLRNSFDSYQSTGNNSDLKDMKQSIFEITEMNMKAVENRSEIAKDTADRAVFWIVITGTLCFIIALILLIRFPSMLIDPITGITHSIEQISNNNYSERINYGGDNELGKMARAFNSMTQKLEEYNNSNLAKIMVEKKRIDTLVSSMQDPVIGLDDNLKIVFANAEAHKALGFKENILVGKYAQELSKSSEVVKSMIKDLVLIEETSAGDTIVETLHNANMADNKQVLEFEVEGEQNYFEQETLHTIVTPTGETDKKVIGHVILLKNITEYKASDTAKTKFITDISREYNLPVTSIEMHIQSLLSGNAGKLSKEQKELVEIIEDDAEKLLDITDELLNISQIDNKRIAVSYSRINPIELLNKAVRESKSLASKKQIDFDIESPSNIPKLLADQDRTAWVLSKLVANAVRYSEQNSAIKLVISQDDSKVEISVSDSSKGISAKYLDKVFDRYFRFPESDKQANGLGLAICKELMNEQGGEISVQSEAGLGSTFTITLPRKKSVG